MYHKRRVVKMEKEIIIIRYGQLSDCTTECLSSLDTRAYLQS